LAVKTAKIKKKKKTPLLFELTSDIGKAYASEEAKSLPSPKPTV
jgi:hypothetical protein